VFVVSGEAPADGMLAVRHPARISTKSSSAALPQNLPRMIAGYNASLSMQLWPVRGQALICDAAEIPPMLLAIADEVIE